MGISEEKQSLAFIRAIMWGFAGFLYSAVFLGVWRYMGLEGAAWWHLPAAAAVAGAFVAAFYSAKRAAIAGAAAGTVSSQVMLIYFPTGEGPLVFIVVTAVAGVVLGIAASFVYERRRGALAVVVAGGMGGLFAGAVLGLPALLLPAALQPVVITLLLVPGTGVLFYAAALRVKRSRSRQLLPHALSVGLTAGWVSVIVGASMWLLAMSLSHELDAATKEAVRFIFSEFPAALLGGIVGGAGAGAAMELSNVRWVSRI